MNNVEDYIISKGFDYKQKDNELIMNCPFCDDTEQKFSINTITGAYQCWHKNKCNQSGNLYTLKKALGDIPDVIYKQKKYIKPDSIIEMPGLRMLDYFKKRGISEQTVKDFKIKNKDNSIVFQYFKDGELVNNKYRTLDKKQWQEKKAEQVLYNRDNVSEKMRELVITEGEIDCMSVWELGFKNVVSIPGGASNMDWISNEWDFLQRFDTYLLAYDIDKAGNENVVKVADRLGNYKCRRVNLPYKDINEWLMNKLTKDVFMDCLQRATDFVPDIIVTMEDLRDEILLLPEIGIKTGFELFDKTLGGLRDGEVTVWSGRNGDGKSTFLNQLALQVLVYDFSQNFCIASFEMKNARLGKLMIKQNGYYINEEGFDKTIDIIGNRLFFIDTIKEITPENLLNGFDYVYHRYGVKNYIVDSLLRINLNNKLDILGAQKQFMNQLLEFAINTGSHVHLVAHPRKGKNDFETIYKVDISGTGDIANLAQNVISIQRPENDNGYDMELKILKNREDGTLGKIKYKFDPEYKRFSEIKKEE